MSDSRRRWLYWVVQFAAIAVVIGVAWATYRILLQIPPIARPTSIQIATAFTGALVAMFVTRVMICGLPEPDPLGAAAIGAACSHVVVAFGLLGLYPNMGVSSSVGFMIDGAVIWGFWSLMASFCLRWIVLFLEPKPNPYFFDRNGNFVVRHAKPGRRGSMFTAVRNGALFGFGSSLLCVLGLYFLPLFVLLATVSSRRAGGVNYALVGILTQLTAATYFGARAAAIQHRAIRARAASVESFVPDVVPIAANEP